MELIWKRTGTPALLWDDPLMNIYWRDCWKLDWERTLTGYRKLRDVAAAHRKVSLNFAGNIIIRRKNFNFCPAESVTGTRSICC